MSDVGEQSASRADVTTAKASGYLQQLCKHFGHKVPASFDARRGRIEFQGGVCELDAADPGVLRLRVVASRPEDRERLEGVVASHLVRFAFREELAVAWRPA
jgi:hypothetical protein